MRTIIISDDLTGASDCGGQLVNYGLDVSVILHDEQDKVYDIKEHEALIFNTDSRSIPPEEANSRVSNLCKRLKQSKVDVLYKKIDSTMRGNIGQEMNAMFDAFRPDFMIIAPAFPQNGRKIINGIHFLNNKPLHETEVSNDPKTPVHESQIERIIQGQSKRKVAHLTFMDLSEGFEFLKEKLIEFKKQEISYVTVDTVDDSDFMKLVKYISQTDFSVIWSGSSGLIKYIPVIYGLKEQPVKTNLDRGRGSVLFVIGSVSAACRQQLGNLLQSSDVAPLEIKSTVIFDEQKLEEEIKRLTNEAQFAVKQGKHLALFSSDEVKQTQQIGRERGLSQIYISNMVSKVLGEVAGKWMEQLDFHYLFLTGGDTAQQVLSTFKVSRFHLLDEVEPGIPLGFIDPERPKYVVTKAGNFGSPMVMLKAINRLRGENLSEADNWNNNGGWSRSGSGNHCQSVKPSRSL